MRITFVGIGTEQFGISILSALAKQHGHKVNLAFSVSLFNDRMQMRAPAISRLFDDRKDVLKTLERSRPDLVAFSPMSNGYQWSLGIAREAKKMFPRVKTVFGGVHVSAVPGHAIAQPEVDYVCIGEGDVALMELLAALEKNDGNRPLANIRYLSPRGELIRGPQIGFIQDLDSLPFYDKLIWEDYFDFRDSYMTLASRGCPYQCTFCCNSYFSKLPEQNRGKYLRFRSVDHFMAELRWAKNRYDVRRFDFFDDVFTFDKKWLKKFIDAYKQEFKIPFEIFTHLRHLDEETVRMLASAGCFSMELGVQTLDDELKKKVLKRYDTKEQLTQVSKWCRKHGVRIRADHMLGLPGEPIEAQEAARQFYVENTPYRIHTYWLKYFPGTEIQQYAIDIGIATPEQIKRINEGHDDFLISYSDTISQPETMKQYQVYQAIFKMITYVPDFIKKRLNPKILMLFPAWFSQSLAFLFDTINGLIKREPHHVIYLKYYLFHMRAIILSKCGLNRPYRMKHLKKEEDVSPEGPSRPSTISLADEKI